MPIKIISECIDFLLKKIDDLNIRTLCELVKKICKKLHQEEIELLNKAVDALENLYNNKPIISDLSNQSAPISSKTKFLILDYLR